MAFRHYGNVLSGSVVGILVVTALQGLSNTLFGWLPGFLGDISFLGIGIPAILSIYFDVFSGCLQAFIFVMLTMLYISGAFPEEKYVLKKQLKAEKKLKKLQAKNN
jgi:F-type H+-transporting ATPase subunit a